MFGLLAYVGPPAWAYFAIAADRDAQMASHGWVCGNPMLGMIFLAAIASTFFSVIATGLGIPSYRTLPSPLSERRVIELLLLTLPAVFGCGFIAMLLTA